LCQKLLELEVDSSALHKRAEKFRESIRSLQKDKRFYSAYASDVAEKKKALLDTLAAFESKNKSLRKLLRTQQTIEVSKTIFKKYIHVHVRIVYVLSVCFFSQMKALSLSKMRCYNVSYQRLTQPTSCSDLAWMTVRGWPCIHKHSTTN